MEQISFFPYSWFIDETEQDFTSIRIYALNQKNQNMCIIVNDFQPFVYLELPTQVNWTPAKALVVKNKLQTLLGKYNTLRSCTLEFKQRLYYAHLKEDKQKKLFPYLLCSFSKKQDIKNLSYKIKNKIQIVDIGIITLKMHEQDADPILQLCCRQHIPTCGWIQAFGKRTKIDDTVTLCDGEYIVKSEHLKPLQKDTVAQPKIMGFDLEVNSTNPAAMPNAAKSGDKIFQISCIFVREGASESEYEKVLLTLGLPSSDVIGNDVTIYSFSTEAKLILGFTELVQERKPNIISGYNILGFDIPYMIDRAKMLFIINEFNKLGFHKFNSAKEKTIKWSSSAFKNQEYSYLDAEGRLFVDLLPLVKRDYKLDNYRLSTVSEFFLKDKKDDLSPKGIFKCYEIGMKGGPKGAKALGICGKYCIQDSVLVVKLMEKLQIWVGLCEMSKACIVTPFVLYTQGQQIKVYSQIYQYCMYNNIVVEKDGYITHENERYVGAHVFDPVPGVYDKVVPFDFCSLYPSVIIAYNIDYSTLVIDPTIPDKDCHVMKWEDHVFCEHDPKIIRKNQLTTYIDAEKVKLTALRNLRNKTKNKERKAEIAVEIEEAMKALKPYQEERTHLVKSKPKFIMCEKRNYRFLKEPQGVIPSVLQHLLDARKQTRVRIAENKEKMKLCADPLMVKDLQLLNTVLDKRQLALKTSANSAYGAMGVRRGYLPFMPGAMATTYMGRINIKLVAQTIPEKFGGQLVYGDSDSNYIHFPHIKTITETWDYAEHVAEEVTKLFPKAISLAFEQVVYVDFLILSKKRYMYTSSDRDGNISKKIGKRGVLLARRDNSPFIRNIYETVITMIFADSSEKGKEKILLFLIDEINKLCSHVFHYRDFVITKAVGDINNLEAINFINEKGIEKTKIGNYTVPLLKNNDERSEQIRKKNAVDEQDYYLKSLPGVVQLAEKMKRRGMRCDAGTRLEYVIIESENNLKDKQSEKVESVDYFANHSDILKIDYLYYLKLLTNPMDQVLVTCFKTKDFVLQQYKFRLLRLKVLEQLKKLFNPSLDFYDEIKIEMDQE